MCRKPAIKMNRERRGGWSFVEVLVTVTILTILMGTLVFSSRIVSNSRKRATALQQLQMVSTAIDRYAGFWPAWRIGSVTIADKGWPDFAPGRVFAMCSNGYGPYETIMNFNDYVMYAGPQWISDDILRLDTNTTLAFQLLASSGKGPYLTDRPGAGMVEAAKLVSGATRILYPGFCSGGGSRPAEVIVDPWGTPLRYFWVYRDASRTSHRGYLPVDFAPIAGDNSPLGVQNAAFDQPAEPAAKQIAVGYVLESAGPDRKFGNVWKINPTAQEIADAEDNLVTSP